MMQDLVTLDYAKACLNFDRWLKRVRNIRGYTKGWIKERKGLMKKERPERWFRPGS